MSSTGTTSSASGELGSRLLGNAALIVIVAGIGVAIGFVVDSPNKRVIEALAGGVFLLLALSVHLSYVLGVLLALLPFPAGTYYGTSNELFIFALVIVYAVKQMIRGQPVFRPTLLDGPVLLLIAATLFSLLHYQGDVKGLWAEVRSFFTAICLYYLVVLGCTEGPHAKRVVAGYIIAFAGAAAVGALQIFFPGTTLIPEFIYVPEEHKWDRFVRAAGTFGNYSTFGQYMALNMVLTSYMFIRSRSPYLKLIFLALVVVAAGTFLSSAMRGALFAMAGGMVYLAVIGRRQVRIRHWIGMIVILVVVMAILGSVMLAYTGTGYLFLRLQGFSLERGTPTTRADTNLFFLGEWLEYPLVGHGPHISLDLGIAGVSTNNPHCQYIYYLYTIGLVGLAGFMWALLRLYSYSLRAVRSTRSSDPFSQALATVFHTMFVIFVVHELFDDYMQVQMYQHIVWGMFGILVVTSRLVLEHDRATAGLESIVHSRTQRDMAPNGGGLQHR